MEWCLHIIATAIVYMHLCVIVYFKFVYVLMARMLLWRIAREYWLSSSLKDVVGHLIINFLWKQTATFPMLSIWLDEIVFRMNGSSSSADHLY